MRCAVALGVHDLEAATLWGALAREDVQLGEL
jgi:hypothetical protein